MSGKRRKPGRPARNPGQTGQQLNKAGAMLKQAMGALQHMQGLEHAAAVIEKAAIEVQKVQGAVEGLEDEIALHRELIWLMIQEPTDQTHARLSELATELCARLPKEDM